MPDSVTSRMPPLGLSQRARKLPMEAKRRQGFNSAEHRALGDAIRIPATDLLPGAYPNDWGVDKLHLADDLVLSYGEIEALAGDLYGDEFNPISSGATFKDQRKRFRDAYNRLLHCNRNELRGILDVMNSETQWLDEQLRQGIWPDQAYASKGFDSQYDSASENTHWHHLYRHYADLAMVNFDHFGPDAVKAYTAGHHEAITAALKARDNVVRGVVTQEVGFLQFQQALAMNAFADHYLSDLFAAGHLRVPRRALTKHEGGSQGGGSAAMSKLMHEEDNTYGLFVTNARGERWHCYGDAHLLTVPGLDNQTRANAAVVLSVSEVWKAFDKGIETGKDSYEALQYIPDLAKASKVENIDWLRLELGREPHDTDYLNFLAQFFVSELNSAVNRHPLDDINSRQLHALPAIPILNFDETPIGFFLDEVCRQMFGVKAGTYGPPNSAVPVPAAPTSGGYVPTVDPWRDDWPRRVRYAVAIVATRAYPGGGSAEFLSDPGPWGPWIDRKPGFNPSVGFPKPPVAPAGVTLKTWLVIRQFEGRPPVVGFRAGDMTWTSTGDAGA